jgi:hypothetical protein
MRSLFATLRSLILPSGALPGSPAIILGPDIPPELVTFYAGLAISQTVVAVIIKRRDATHYAYNALVFETVGLTPYEAWGSVSGVSVVEDFRLVVNPTFGVVQFGKNSNVDVEFYRDLIVTGANGQLLVLGDAQLQIAGQTLSGEHDEIFFSNMNTGNTTSMNFVDMPGPLNLNVQKLYPAADTKLMGTIAGTFYSGGAAAEGAIFGVRLDGGTDYATSAAVRLANATHLAHTPYYGQFDIPGLAADVNYEVRARWKSQTGGSINVDNNDCFTFTVAEVPA